MRLQRHLAAGSKRAFATFIVTIPKETTSGVRLHERRHCWVATVRPAASLSGTQRGMTAECMEYTEEQRGREDSGENRCSSDEFLILMGLPYSC